MKHFGHDWIINWFPLSIPLITLALLLFVHWNYCCMIVPKWLISFSFMTQPIHVTFFHFLYMIHYHCKWWWIINYNWNVKMEIFLSVQLTPFISIQLINFHEFRDPSNPAIILLLPQLSYLRVKHFHCLVLIDLN